MKELALIRSLFFIYIFIEEFYSRLIKGKTLSEATVMARRKNESWYVE